MAVSRDSTAAVAEARPSVTFAVERFGWVDDERLEVAGRWFGLRGQRFLRPTLDVEVDGRNRRLLALLEHKPWAADDGEEWVAAFGWQGEPIQLVSAELAVGPDLAIELPPPTGGRPASPTRSAPPAPSTELRSAGRPRAEVELDLVAARDEVDRLAGELVRLRATHAARIEELQRRLSAEREAAAQLTQHLGVARATAADAESESASRLERLEEERDAAVAAGAAALAEVKRVESEREAALRGRAAAEQERDAAVRARDSARGERNAWMSRARAAMAEKSPAHRRPPAASARAGEPPAAEPQPAPAPQATADGRPGASDPAAEREHTEPATPTPREAQPQRDRRAAARARTAARRASADPAGGPRAAGAARPGVRTVRIGFDESTDPAPARPPDQPRLRLRPPGRRVPRPAMPYWAPPLFAALALILVVVVVVLLIL